MSSEPVFVSITQGNEIHPVGRLWHLRGKGRETASFEYAEAWLKNPHGFALEPTLALLKTAYHTASDQVMFGAFGDTAPDRWGRVLMRREERRRAKEASETPRSLSELDYILGVNDEPRMGALRFSQKEGGPFLSLSTGNGIPPLVVLPKLLAATERFLDDEESADDLRLLLAPGTSLGGARPKASVRDTDGSLLIAKFPRKDDDGNVVLWEALALKLASKAGLSVPVWYMKKAAGKPILMLKRFDRAGKSRIPFLSAMSMLDARDNQQRSYIELAYAIMQNGSEPLDDLRELWHRIVFSILISNTDDHLRNHGFLFDLRKGWLLSPAYDMNPTPVDVKPRVLSTCIDLDDSTASLELALSVAEEFRLPLKEAKVSARRIAKVTSQWKEDAQSLGLLKKEIERMESAFEHEDSRKARSL